MRQSGVKCLACMAAVLAVAGAITWASQPTSKPVAPGAGKNLLPEGISSAADVYVIPIRGEINATLYDVLKYKVIKCRAAGAKLILFDMNTPGGEVMSALNITQMIKSDLARVRTICYVRPNAISAGAMIAVACNRLVMSETGILGDCAPISPGGKIEGVEREKIETVIRTEFRQSAQKNGYNEALAQSMVSADLEVWKLRHKTTGEIRYALATDEQGKVSIPPGLAKGDSKPDSAWEVVTVVVPAGKLLTMNAAEAAELGFAAAVLPAGSDKPMAEFMTFLGLAGEPVVMGDDIATGLALFLTHPVVTGLLVMGLLFFGYAELHAPGFSIPGILALICLALLIGGHYVIGLANYWEIALLLVGVGLLAVEIFVIPGFGVAGVAGALCVLVGLLAILIPNAPDELPIPTTSLGWNLFRTGLLALAMGFVGAIVLAGFLMKYFDRVPLANKLLLPEAAAVSGVPVAEGSPILRLREGDLGEVTGMCRPVGVVRFGNDFFDAMTEGDCLDPGTKVRVIRCEGNRLVVEKV